MFGSVSYDWLLDKLMDNRGSCLLNDPLVMSFMDDGDVFLMNNFFFRFMNNWNMFLSNYRFMNNRLNMFMENILMMLVDNISVSLLNNVLMMLMNDFFLILSDDSSFLLLSYNLLFRMS